MSKVKYEPKKVIQFGAISAAFANVGGVTTHRIRIAAVDNNTEGDMYISIDGTNDHIFVAAGAYKLLDIQANYVPKIEDIYCYEIGTQFEIRQITAPVSGAVYIMCQY